MRKLSKAHGQYRCGILLMGLYFEFSLLGFFSSNSFLQHSLMLQAVVSTADAPCCCCQLRVHVGSLPPISFTPPKALSGKKQLMPLAPCQAGSALLVPAGPGHVPSPSRSLLRSSSSVQGMSCLARPGAVGIFQLFHASGSKECCLSRLVSDISWAMEQERIKKSSPGTMSF